MHKTEPLTTLLKAFEDFFRIEAAGGVVLLLATVVALFWANSPLAPLYDTLREMPLTVGAGSWALSKPAILWINDGLMAVFFFVIGLEIKREVLVGGLSSPSRVVMPVAAAVGGMVVPAALFLALNAGEPTAQGWGVAMATDIAFALGVLSLLGPRVPVGLKIFLTAVAIVDDIGAILVIALFYTAELSLPALGVGLAALAAMALLNIVWKTRHYLPYLLLGVVVWLAFLKSGIHATIAGVLAAVMIPARTDIDCMRFVEKLRGAAIAFEGDPRAVELAKLAVLLSSLAAGLGGWLLLRFMPEKARG
jgi:NhaA family Na+:H+ antiporter